LIYIENPESAIIFCRTKENVDKLALQMSKDRYPCSALHGGMLQDDRLKAMERFKRGEFTYLVSTDVAARGIDVEDITHIINYDVPVEVESYVHRIGRTGRAGKSGKAITFASAGDHRYLRDIEDYVGYKIPVMPVPSSEEVESARLAYNKITKKKPVLKENKSSRINSDIEKIYINAGKKKKIRPGDIVGAIIGIDGINADDVGVIDIQDNFSYIDILNGKGNIVIDALQHETVKGKTVRAQRALK
jgi:superfamily II DNA/RNA helicase